LLLPSEIEKQSALQDRSQMDLFNEPTA